MAGVGCEKGGDCKFRWEEAGEKKNGRLRVEEDGWREKMIEYGAAKNIKNMNIHNKAHYSTGELPAQLL